VPHLSAVFNINSNYNIQTARAGIKGLVADMPDPLPGTVGALYHKNGCDIKRNMQL